MQEAWQLAPVSDQMVVFWELQLDMHALCVEKKLVLSHLSIETSLGSKEGDSDQQMMPQLLNEAFSVKAT